MATSPIDLHWSLTTPEANGTVAKTYKPSEVASLTKNPYFEITDQYLRFTAPVNGFTTSGSKKTRCEFREYKPGSDKEEMNWTGTGGTHTMGASLVVNQVPKKVGKKEGSVYVGQIHVDGGKSPLFKFTYQYQGDESKAYKMVASFRKSPIEPDPNSEDDGVDNNPVFEDIAEGARIQYYLKVSSTGKLTGYVQVGTVRKEFAADLDLWLKDNPQTKFYFKAGVYNNSEALSATEDANHSEAFFYKLNTTHS